jgi:hypothetical protein
MIRRASMDRWTEVPAINFNGHSNAIPKRPRRRLMTWRTGTVEVLSEKVPEYLGPEEAFNGCGDLV